MEIKFHVRSNTLSLAEPVEEIASGNRSAVSFSFTFSSEWDGLYKTAVLDHADLAYPYLLPLSGGVVSSEDVPPLFPGEWTVGIIGTSASPVAIEALPERGEESAEEYLLASFGEEEGLRLATLASAFRVLPGVWQSRLFSSDGYDAMVAAVISAKEAMEECTEAVSEEAEAREAADDALSGDIADEAAARSAADDALSEDIADEAAARSAADTELSSAIQTERTARQNGEAATLLRISEDEALIRAKANAADVYSKERADQLLFGKADKSDTYTKARVDTALAAKADKSSTYTKTEADEVTAELTASIRQNSNRIAGLEHDVSGLEHDLELTDGALTVERNARLAAEDGITSALSAEAYHREQADTALGDRVSAVESGKADKSTTYTKTETDSLLSAKAPQSTTYTKTEVDTALAAKADAADVYTKSAMDNALGSKADKSDTYTKTQVDTFLSGKAAASDVEELEEAVDEITDVTLRAGRNRYDPNDPDAEIGKKFTSTKTGATTNANGFVISGYIDVHEHHGKYLTYSAKVITTGEIHSPNSIYAVCVYDQNKSIIQKEPVWDFSSYTIPNDAYYVRVNIVLENGGNNRITQISVTDDNVETVVEEYAPPEEVVTVKPSAIPGYADLNSDVQGLTVGGSKTYGFSLGGLANDGITPSASTNRAHSEWIYSKGLTEIAAPTGYTVKAVFCFDEAFSLIGQGNTPNGNAQLLQGSVWVRITVADAEDASKDLTDDVDDITVTVSGADIALGRDAADKYYLPKTLPINPEWENWENERYSWGFDKRSDKPFIEADAPFEANMISVKGGKGRWHTQGTPTHTPSSTAFVDGGHLFEGWNADETLRLTMLIGKYDYKMACIQCYGTPGLNEGQRVYGYIKVGSDNANFGVNFGEKSAKFFVPILLSTTQPTEVSPMYETGDTTTVPVGAMYYDTTADRVKVMTGNGWKSLSLEE